MKFLPHLIRLLLLCLLPFGQVHAAADVQVDINSADAIALDAALVNVGQVRAQAIIDYRRENGPFRSVEQLAMVKGIGIKTVEMNRHRIILGKGAQEIRPAMRGQEDKAEAYHTRY
ncbi:competence protein ComEA [Lysobacter pythonis]|uniref:Competence protein ComEA n=1 Tax=Solilutibacter pythonis TaxID=2483112 RepID=A0A3M2HWJ6_9GAMM|nr:helix-hairpin-helix domain-containing protein [Lysobacter pythonis]RMH94096.1 competence protein ComEA [Lysobacter pythonis]